MAGVIIYRTNGFYFPAGGIELPIFWAIVQVIQAMLGRSSLAMTSFVSKNHGGAG